MLINDVQCGDIIKSTGGKGIEVKKVEFDACSSRGVHINERFCWDSGTHIELSRVGKDEENSEEKLDPGVLV